MTLTNRDRTRLIGVHPELVAIIERADAVTYSIKGYLHFMVLEGVRTPQRQRWLLNQGATTTLKSRHLTGHAVDIAPLSDGKPSWHWPHYDRLAPIIKAAAGELGIPIEWGGDWTSFRDGPHWQLPWQEYPA